MDQKGEENTRAFSNLCRVEKSKADNFLYNTNL